MAENNEEKIILEIKEGLNAVDSKIEIKVPDMNYFRDLVSNVEEKKKLRSRREFLVFLAFALLVMSAFIFMCYRYSVVFLAIQVLSILFIPVGLYSWYRRQRRQTAE